MTRALKLLPITIFLVVSGIAGSVNAQTLNPIISAGTQNAAAVAITGGAINGAVIGGVTPAAGAFTAITLTTPLAAAYGGAGTVTGALRADGAGVVSQAACGDLSNGSSMCAQAANNVAISGGTVQGLGNYFSLATNDQSTARVKITNIGAGGQEIDLTAGTPGVSNAGFAIYDATNSHTALQFDASENAKLFAGLTVGSLANATGNYVCVPTPGSTAFTYEAVACPASTMSAKNPAGYISPEAAERGLDKLSTSGAPVWTYKGKGPQEHVGLYAQDVCALDERLCSRDKNGVIQNYDTTGLIAYLIADRKALEVRISRLEHHHAQ
jgi:hypothetical protein